MSAPSEILSAAGQPHRGGEVNQIIGEGNNPFSSSVGETDVISVSLLPGCMHRTRTALQPAGPRTGLSCEAYYTLLGPRRGK